MPRGREVDNGDIHGQLDRLVRRAVWDIEHDRPIEGVKTLRHLRANVDMAVLTSRTSGEGETENLLRLKMSINHILESLANLEQRASAEVETGGGDTDMRTAE